MGDVKKMQQILLHETIKRATQVYGHFLKLHFCMFKKSQGKHNSLDCHKSFWNIFHLIENFICSNLTQIKCFLHIQSIQTFNVDRPYFFEMSFFSTKCAPFLLKIGEDFNIND
jgi:hypothetical protein